MSYRLGPSSIRVDRNISIYIIFVTKDCVDTPIIAQPLMSLGGKKGGGGSISFGGGGEGGK